MNQEKSNMFLSMQNSLPENMSGKFVLYWMQAAQRTRFNRALNLAAAHADSIKKPLLVFFGLSPKFPEANFRHYSFMIEGLADVSENLRKMGIGFVLKTGNPPELALEVARNASSVFLDYGPLRIQKEWRAQFAKFANCRVYQVETESVFPLSLVADKELYSAAQLRKKISPMMQGFLVGIEQRPPKTPSLDMSQNPFFSGNASRILSNVSFSNAIAPSPIFKGGEDAARRRLAFFLSERLHGYAKFANDPGLDFSSNLSPYLHFGQISPLEIALEATAKDENAALPFIEELVVRRELAMNFVHFNPRYDNYACLPDWAKKSLEAGKKHRREYLYSHEDFEGARTHDRYWNAAQTEMMRSGKMSNYMRMYWGKKIIEWTENPETAFEIAVSLNNKYELDGRDPNAFAGVAWCFGKHDRPWKERQIFGMVRYMNDKGLDRKFDMERYLKKVDTLPVARENHPCDGILS